VDRVQDGQRGERHAAAPASARVRLVLRRVICAFSPPFIIS
jgi:hypothetical protein